ncbi:PRC-barrel domain-containing protein [uncultured Roseibium sp.]|uniref:PRC-barrel domain-containing protein n=1 Tax=uncultured Roseibium sp. TaxID=1936171 RepID=UPI002635D3F9|nr:PRC-barrel domain-containing protein [uncultured Roseibium sp.]
MIRKFLATTALTAVVAAGAAYASDTRTDAGMTGDRSAPVFERFSDKPSDYNVGGYLETSESQVLATTLIGKSIYTRLGDDAEVVGDVNDMVMSEDGKAEAVVVGVGGFLGLGEKQVAVSFERLSLSEIDGVTWLTINSTREELENAPEFDRDLIVGKAGPEQAISEDYDQTAQLPNGALPSTAPAADPVVEAAQADTQRKVEDNLGVAEAPALQGGNQSTGEDGVSVDQTSVSVQELIGTAVVGADQEQLGEVSDILLGAKEDNVKAYLIDVGGFLGLGEKQVAFAASGLDIYKDETGTMHIYSSVTQKKLESVPEYDEQAFRMNPDAVLVK